MKTILEHYNLLIAMTILTSIAIFLKCICAILYQMLSKEVDQITNTKNKWLRSMITKFESCYQLKMPIQNTSSFIELYLERYRFAGLSLRTLENFDIFCAFILCGTALLSVMGGIYYSLPTNWILIQGITLIIFLFFLGMGEVLFQTRHKRLLLHLQLDNYFSNTLHPKYIQQYLHPEERKAYEQEYFLPEEPEKTKQETPAISIPEENNASVLSADMQELIDSLLEESKLTEEIQKKHQELTTAATNEKYRLVEEIMKEYM